MSTRSCVPFLIASVALVACDPSGDDATPATGTSDVVTAEIASAQDPIVSPDGKTLVFVRTTARSRSELVHVDLETTPPTEKIVNTFVGATPELHATPGGKYFYSTDGFDRHHFHSWDLSFEREVRGDRIVVDPTDRHAVVYLQSNLYADGKYFARIYGQTTDLLTGTEVHATSEVDGMDRLEQVGFSPNGEEIVFRRWNELVTYDLATAKVTKAFTDIGRAEPLVSTYDGSSIVLATYDTNEKWGPNMLVVQRRDGSSTKLTPPNALFADGSMSTDEHGYLVFPKRVAQHCIAPRGQDLFVFTNAGPGSAGIAKWSRASGYEALENTLGARPTIDFDIRCTANVTDDGSQVSYLGTRADGSKGFATKMLSAQGQERFLVVPQDDYAVVLGNGDIGASGKTSMTYGESGDISFFDLRLGTPVLTTAAEKWPTTPRFANGDLLTLEEAGKALYRTSAGAHTLLTRTNEPISKVLFFSDSRAVVTGPRGVLVLGY